jgi:hypothetical protein
MPSTAQKWSDLYQQWLVIRQVLMQIDDLWPPFEPDKEKLRFVWSTAARQLEDLQEKARALEGAVEEAKPTIFEKDLNERYARIQRDAEGLLSDIQASRYMIQSYVDDLSKLDLTSDRGRDDAESNHRMARGYVTDPRRRNALALDDLARPVKVTVKTKRRR